MDDLRKKTDATEWGILERSPLWVFSAVAGADGKIDGQETDSFRSLLSHPEDFRDHNVRSVFASTAQQLEELLSEHEQDDRLLDQAFVEIREVLDRTLSDDDAREFKLALLAVAGRIAEASKGGFLGLHGRVSQDEKAAVVFIAARLGLEPADFEPSD